MVPFPRLVQFSTPAHLVRRIRTKNAGREKRTTRKLMRQWTSSPAFSLSFHGLLPPSDRPSFALVCHTSPRPLERHLPSRALRASAPARVLTSQPTPQVPEVARIGWCFHSRWSAMYTSAASCMRACGSAQLCLLSSRSPAPSRALQHFSHCLLHAKNRYETETVHD